MTLPSRDSNPFPSSAPARERGHGAPWSGEAGQAGDQGVILASLANGGSVGNSGTIIVMDHQTYHIAGVFDNSGL
ncbi:MAG: hypothetical protein ABI306_00870, partial [Caulobacteraceae bacterium]